MQHISKAPGFAHEQVQGNIHKWTLPHRHRRNICLFLNLSPLFPLFHRVTIKLKLDAILIAS